MHKDRIAEEVMEHMLGYVDEKNHDSDDMYTLGYLDTKHWVEAATQNIFPATHIPALKDLAKLVDKRYNTDFHGDIVEALK